MNAEPRFFASKAPEAISSSYAERELIGRSQSEFYEGNPHNKTIKGNLKLEVKTERMSALAGARSLATVVDFNYTRRKARRTFFVGEAS